MLDGRSFHVEYMLMTHVTQYETNSEDVRHLFEEHGEIKTFFDLISNRGMVFVTYVSGHGFISCHTISDMAAAVRYPCSGEGKRATSRFRD